MNNNARFFINKYTHFSSSYLSGVIFRIYEFSSIVNELGEPDYFNYYSPQHYTGCIITLDWPVKHISVTGAAEEKCPAPDTKVDPDIKATNLLYTTHERFALIDEKYKYPWPGFSEH